MLPPIPPALALAVLQALGAPAPASSAYAARIDPVRPPFDLPILLRLPDDDAALVGVADFDGDGVDDAFSFAEDGTRDRFRALRFDDRGGLIDEGWSWSLVESPNISFTTLRPLVGDVTGDGLADVLVDRQNAEVVNGSPAGFLVRDGFAGPAPILWGVSVGGSVVDWTLGRRGSAGPLDFVVVHAGDDPLSSGPHLRWWTFTGGSFSGSSIAPLASVDDARGPVTLDATGDGVDDVLVVVGSPPTAVHLYATVGGSPTSVGVLPLPAEFTAVDARLSLADLDADGDLDAALVGVAGQTVQILPLVQAAPGVLVPGPVQTSSITGVAAPSTGAVAWLDPDGDGDQDLLLGEGSRLLVPSAGGVAEATIASPALPGERFLAARDLDGDGHDDWIASGSIRFGTGRVDGGFLTPVDGAVSSTGALVLDWEDDGDLDFLAGLGVVRINDGTGCWHDGGNGWPAPDANHLFGRTASIGDFDGDGRADYLAQYLLLQPFPLPPIFLAMALLVDDGVGGYVASGNATDLGVEISDDATRPWPSADVDGDGDLDVVTDEGWWRNDGSGHFGGAVVASWSGHPRVIADFDLDGDQDLVISDGGQATLLRYSGGAFTQVPLGSFPPDADAYALDWAPGPEPDLVVVRPNDQEVHLFEWTGSTLALRAVATVPGLENQPAYVHDVDGDGRRDVLVQRQSATGAYLLAALLLVGPGASIQRGPEQLLSAPIGSFLDADGDGDLDGLVAGRAIANLTYDGTLGGRIRQYGTGLAGGGGAVPVLGVGGPLRVGAPEPATLRLRRTAGSSVGFLLLGTGETEFPFPPVPGLTILVDPILVTLPLSTAGPAGVPGAGEMTLTIQADPALAGVTRYQQAFVLDALSPTGLAASNGLATTMGLE